MTKNEAIARLNELSGLLGRNISTSGTVTELEMLLREAEEEYAAMLDEQRNSSAGGVTKAQKFGAVPTADKRGLITFTANKTLHMDAYHATQDTVVPVVISGEKARMDGEMAKELIEQGLITWSK